jgi:hypothetical protein
MKGLISIAILIGTVFVIRAQGPRAMLSQPTVDVGEKTTLTYLFPLEVGKVRFQAQKTTIPSQLRQRNGKLSDNEQSPLEVLGTFEDTILIENGKRFWVGIYEIIAWDTGMYFIPGPKIMANGQSAELPDVELTVRLMKSVKGQEIYDIKESFSEVKPQKESVKEALKSSFWWIVALVVCASLAFWFLFRKKKEPMPEPVTQRSLTLAERTLAEIQQLDEQRLWEKGQLKEHYSALSHILRTYLSERYTLQLLERTTHESRLLLRQMGLHDELIALIASILNESDMVKFAKSVPDEEAVYTVSERAKTIVHRTKKQEEHV